MKVTRLPRDPGPAAWNELLPSDGPAVKLQAERTADWLVIGAGFAGLSAARRLQQLRPLDSICVLEARRVAEGPAGRNSGFMIDLPHDLASHDYGGDLGSDNQQTIANRAAIEFARQIALEYEMPTEAFAQSGKINAAAGEKGQTHNLKYAAHLQKMGEEHTLLDATEMQEITGIPYYQGGLFTPGTAILQPAMYIRGLASGLVKSGVRIFENSPVMSLDQRGLDWLATTPRGRVTAANVILAVNGHVESFGHFKRRLMHVFTYASMTEALDLDAIGLLGGQRAWGLTPADPMGTTVRRINGIGGDRIVIRNRFTYDPGMEVDHRRIANVSRDHDRAFRARFPMLSGVKMQFRWGGRLCLSRNNVPAVGKIDTGLFTAACQNGLGTAKGTLGGMLAADLAVGHGSTLLNEFKNQARPSRLPPEPITWLGANTVMRWGELKAGREF